LKILIVALSGNFLNSILYGVGSPKLLWGSPSTYGFGATNTSHPSATEIGPGLAPVSGVLLLSALTSSGRFSTNVPLAEVHGFGSALKAST